MFSMPLEILNPAATMDLQYRLPPPQTRGFSIDNVISLVLLLLAFLALAYFMIKSQREKARLRRQDALNAARRLLLKRGGNDEDWGRLEHVFGSRPKMDPEAVSMVHETFAAQLRPLLSQMYGEAFADRVHSLYYPPPKDTRAFRKTQDIRKLVDNIKSDQPAQASGAVLDLMDALLRPGLLLNVSFEGVEGLHSCLVMNYDPSGLNVTLPANAPQLLGLLRPGLSLEGSFENGPSLMAFVSAINDVSGGEMPFCRMDLWKSAWEIRKRDAVRLRVSLQVDFQHMSAKSSDVIKLSHVEQRMTEKKSGQILDLSLGGCCLRTRTAGDAYMVGDFVRFQAPLAAGQPPATLLGSVVNIKEPERDSPAQDADADTLLHIQFLALDDVSQRLLARAVHQLQEAAKLDDWMRAQTMFRKMKKSPAPEERPPAPKQEGEPGAP